MNYIISVIVPTYNRYKEVLELLESLNNQKLDRSQFEVIIVDQNDIIDLSPLKQIYSSLNINHIKTNIKGIAHAKNIGIKESLGEIITFADDDALYYDDTLTSAIECFEVYKNIDIYYGRIYDRESKKNILRNWSSKPVKLNYFNFSTNYIAIACFTKNKNILFNENFGLGTKHKVGEEFDYIIQALRMKLNILYCPNIEMWHPDVVVYSMDKQKTFDYAKGYGAICRKNLNIFVLGIYFSSITYQIAFLIRDTLSLKFKKANKRFLAIKGRLIGFFSYSEK